MRKPVKQSELLEAFTRTLGSSARASDSREPHVSRRIAQFGPIKVLLAEDSLVNQKLVVGLLEKHGSTVRVTGNGREAVGALESEQFDVVLMDVQMPEMDGFEATVEIRRREQSTGRHIPIIALTAHAMRGDRDRCLDAGMDEYLAKPVRAEQLFDTIALVLRETGQQEPTADSSAAAAETAVNWEEALRCVNGDHTVLHDLIKAVLQEAPKMLEAVQRAVSDREEDNLKLAAHTLKGSIRYFGVNKVFDQAFQLERMGRDGISGRADEIAASLSADMQQLMHELREYLERNRMG
jgi:CheY-like chemotaxis protein